MEAEIINLIKICLYFLLSLLYCYFTRKLVPAGTKRFLFLLPIISFYLFIPLSFNSVHLRGTLGFFFAWLANFKLLLFAFDKGPLSSDPSISLSRFAALTCFPIKIQQNSTKKITQIESRSIPSNPNQTHQNGGKRSNFDTDPSSNPNQPHQNGGKRSNFYTDPSKQKVSTSKGHTPFIQYAIKVILLGVLVKIYDYSDQFHPKILLGMYCFQIYFMLEIMLAVVAALARSVLGLELEPQFNDPLLSTSLQDFWGRRWNLMVTSILRPTVYDPTVKAARNLVGDKWAPLPAVLATFVVSGLMHELILYYMGRLKPTFLMTWFFVLHGLCLTVEIALKKWVTGRCRLPRLVSGPLTAGFIFATCLWIFLPEFIRCRVDVMAFEEYATLSTYVKKNFAFVS